MEEKEFIVDYEDLQNYTSEIFKCAGMSEEDAKFQAKSLVTTNLWGVDSHGVMRVPIYAQRLQSKAINPRPDIKTIKGNNAFEVMEGDNGPGAIVAQKAMKRAIELAKKYSVGIVGVRNSNHFGAAALYSKLATDEGMVGIAMTNVKPLIVAPGASKPVAGNNPFAIGIPTFGDFPFMLDMSLSVVAGGKLSLAIKKGEKIPTHWATDKNGKPTDDPKEAFEGFLLPMGGFKGLGLAYAIDMLSGVLTGGYFSHQVKSMYENPEDPSLTSHMMIAINPEMIISKEELQLKMSEYIDNLKATPVWEENGELYLPGELEYRKSLKRKEEGINLPKKIYEDLIEWGNKLEVKGELPLKVRASTL